MTALSDQNRALVELLIGPRSAANIDMLHLDVAEVNRLLDAARAEGRRFGLLDTIRCAGVPMSDQVSNEFLELVPEEIRLKIARLSTDGDTLASDAARYRWFRDGPYYELMESGEELDAYVDGNIIRAAIQAATGAVDAPRPHSTWQRPRRP